MLLYFFYLQLFEFCQSSHPIIRLFYTRNAYESFYKPGYKKITTFEEIDAVSSMVLLPTDKSVKKEIILATYEYLDLPQNNIIHVVKVQKKNK